MLRRLCSASSIFLSRLFNKDNDNYQKNGRSWTKTFQDDPLFDVTAKDEQQQGWDPRLRSSGMALFHNHKGRSPFAQRSSERR